MHETLEGLSCVEVIADDVSVVPRWGEVETEEEAIAYHGKNFVNLLERTRE